MNILVAEPLAQAGLDLLRAQPGWNVIVSSPKEYAAHLAGADALLVRSAVQVTREVLAQAPRLRVIGRAGVGVDNVDLDAATEAGVLVMNAPGGGKRKNFWATSCGERRSGSWGWAASAGRWCAAPAPSRCGCWRTILTSPRSWQAISGSRR